MASSQWKYTVALVLVASASAVRAQDAGVATDAPLVELDAGSDAGVGSSTLEPRNELLETVVVGTPEYRTAGSTHTLRGDRLKRAELDDAAMVLQSVPGVAVRGEDGFGLRPNIGLRGANPDRSKKVTLMEDGILFGPAPYSAPAAYYFPLVTRMETVRVTKGPSSILYGPQTVGGAVDFITRDFGPGISASFDGALGQYWYRKAHGTFSAANDTSGFLVEGVYLGSDGFKQLDSLGGNTGFDKTEWMLKGRHRIDLGEVHHQFDLKLGYATENSNETYLGLTDADFRAGPLRRYVSSELDHMQWHRSQIALTHTFTAPTWNLQTTAYRNDFARVWRKVNRLGTAAVADVLSSPQTPRNAIFLGVLRGEQDSTGVSDSVFVGPNNRSFVSQGLQTTFRTSFDTGPVHHAIEARARYHYDSIDRLHTEDQFLMQGGRLVDAKAPTLVLVDNFDSTHAVALSVMDAIDIWRFTFTPGVRVELINSSSRDQLSNSTTWGSTNVVLPGIGAHFAITEHLGVLGGVYRGFSPPAPGQGSLAIPELAMNVEGGARWARTGERLEAIGFFNDYANLTDVCTFSNGCVSQDLDRQFNGGRAHIYGLEVFGEKRWRIGQATLPLSFAYTLTGTRMLTSFQSADPVWGNVEEGDELPYVPRHQLNISAGIDIWRIGAHAQLFFIDRMREVAGQGALEEKWATDAQVSVDVHLSFRITDWASLYADGRNLTDGHFIVGRRPFGARPNAPRTFIGGIKLQY